MDRRLFVTGLLGAIGTAGIATVLTRQAEALAAVPSGALAPQSDALPELPKLPESDGPLAKLDEGWEWDDGDEGFELAHYPGRRRRRRVRRWRRVCRRWWHNGHWRRRCRRRPHWVYIWFWI